MFKWIRKRWEEKLALEESESRRSHKDWLEDEEILATCGVQVVHHCEAELRRRYQEKRLAAGKRQWTETIPREGLTQ